MSAALDLRGGVAEYRSRRRMLSRAWPGVVLVATVQVATTTCSRNSGSNGTPPAGQGGAAGGGGQSNATGGRGAPAGTGGSPSAGTGGSPSPGTGGVTNDAAVGDGPNGSGDAGGASGTPGLSVALAVGPFSSCVIDDQTLVHCFGRCGPIGHGGSRELAPAGLHARAVAVGRAFGCALLVAAEDGSVLRCWGGDPVADGAPLLTDAAAAAELVAGENHACVRSTAGAVTCWGDAAHNPPAGLIAKALAASGAMTCAIVADDSVRCWGPHPVAPPADLRARRLALGAERSDFTGGARFGCAIALDDQIRCWGDDSGGVLTAPAGLRARDLGAASAFACAAGLADGAVTCWGTLPGFGTAPPATASVSRLALSFRIGGAVLADRTFAFWGDLADGRGTAPGGIHAP